MPLHPEALSMQGREGHHTIDRTPVSSSTSVNGSASGSGTAPSPALQGGSHRLPHSPSFCTNCGHLTAPAVVFCGNCGTRQANG
jgi:hypothetical protein